MGGLHCDEKMDPIRSGFGKMRGQTNLRTIKKKDGQQDKKSRIKLVQNPTKWSIDRFRGNIRLTLGQIIFVTKCDEVKKGTQRDRKMPKRGLITPREVPFNYRNDWLCL